MDSPYSAARAPHPPEMLALASVETAIEKKAFEPEQMARLLRKINRYYPTVASSILTADGPLNPPASSSAPTPQERSYHTTTATNKKRTKQSNPRDPWLFGSPSRASAPDVASTMDRPRPVDAFCERVRYNPTFFSPLMVNWAKSNNAQITDANGNSSLTDKHSSEDSHVLVNQQSESYFFKLPAEIRNIIYAHLLTRHEPLEATTMQVTRRGGLCPAILSACRITNQEAIRFLYSSNRFLVSHPPPADDTAGIPLAKFDLVVPLPQQPLLSDLTLEIHSWPEDITADQAKALELKDHMYMLTRLLIKAGPSLQKLELVLHGKNGAVFLSGGHGDDNFEGYLGGFRYDRQSPFVNALEDYVSLARVTVRFCYPFGMYLTEISTNQIGGQLRDLVLDISHAGFRGEVLRAMLNGRNLVDRDLAPIVAAVRAGREAEYARRKARYDAASSMYDDFIA